MSEGVEIGDFCVVAAGGAVAPNAIIPDDSFAAGVPTEILWQTEPARRAQMEATGGGNYARLSEVYQAEGLGHGRRGRRRRGRWWDISSQNDQGRGESLRHEALSVSPDRGPMLRLPVSSVNLVRE